MKKSQLKAVTSRQLKTIFKKVSFTTVILKLEHLSESPGGRLIKVQIAGPPPELLTSFQVIKAQHSENHCFKTDYPEFQIGSDARMPLLFLTVNK